MPKVSNKALDNQINKLKRSSGVAASQLIASGVGNFVNDSPDVPVRLIPIEHIHPREINDFELSNIPTLAESIEQFGLIDPISVIHRIGDGEDYTIVAGHRRYTAFKLLHTQHPEEERFSRIPACVYELTDDERLLQRGLPYIDASTEEELYRDSNLQSRQLSYTEVAKHIRHIIERIDDENYFRRLNNLSNQSDRYSETKGNKAIIITKLLSDYSYQGWQKETVRRYLKLYEAVKSGSIPESVLDEIEEGSYTVKSQYNRYIAKEQTPPNMEIEKMMSKFGKIMQNVRTNKAKLTGVQKEQLKQWIEELSSIVE